MKAEIYKKGIREHPRSSIFLISENAPGGRVPGSMGSSYVFSPIDLKIIDMDSQNLNGLGMSRPLPCAEKNFEKNLHYKNIVNTKNC